MTPELIEAIARALYDNDGYYHFNLPLRRPGEDVDHEVYWDQAQAALDAITAAGWRLEAPGSVLLPRDTQHARETHCVAEFMLRNQPETD